MKDKQISKRTTGIYLKDAVLGFDDWDKVSVGEASRTFTLVSNLHCFGPAAATDDVRPPWECYEALAVRYVEADRNDEWRWGFDRPGTVDDAKTYLGVLQVLRSANAGRKATASCAMWLGVLAERMRVREHEPDALRGKTTKENLRIGRERQYGTPEEKEGRYRRLYQHYCELVKTGIEKDKAMKQTARQFGVSKRTVHRARKEFTK